MNFTPRDNHDRFTSFDKATDWNPKILPLVALAAGGAVAGGVSNYLSSKKQAEAAKQATKAEAKLAGKQAEAMQGAAEWSVRDNEAAEAASVDDLMSSHGDALSSLAAGNTQARNTLADSRGDALGYVGQAASAAGSNIRKGYGDALSGLHEGYGAGATSSVYDNLSASDFQQDPDYQFRLSEGLRAINQSAAARGGRAGGDTLKALSDYAQNTASQEYGNYAQRRMTADLAAQQNKYGLAGVQANLQAGQGDRLSSIATGVGQQRAGIAADFGQRVAGMEQGLGQETAAMQQGLGSTLANLRTNAASNRANIASTGAGGAAGAMMQTLPGLASQVPYAGAGYQAFGNAVNNGLGNLAYLYAAGGMGGGGGQAPAPGANAANVGVATPAGPYMPGPVMR